MSLPMKKSTLIRGAINLAVGVTTYSISNAIIKNNTADPETLAQRASLAVGSFVLSTMVAEKAVAWADYQTRGAIQAANDVKDSDTVESTATTA